MKSRTDEIKKKVTDTYKTKTAHHGRLKKDAILMRDISIDVVLSEVIQMIEKAPSVHNLHDNEDWISRLKILKPLKEVK